MSDRDNPNGRAAYHAAFRSKTLGLIDTLKLTPEEVIGLALTLSAAFGAKLQRQQLHAMLDAAIDETVKNQGGAA